jgi:predicted RNA-binding protein YlqC (UPF0109 family)
MKQLIEDIAKSLVDVPEEVVVTTVDGEHRTILGAAGMKLNRRYTLEILE